MSNVVNLKEYREAKECARLDEWTKMWIAYWFLRGCFEALTLESLSAVTAIDPRGYLEKEISMTVRQKAIRSDLEAWEAYINNKWLAMTEPMREFAMEQSKRHLKTLLKVQTEELDRG